MSEEEGDKPQRRMVVIIITIVRNLSIHWVTNDTNRGRIQSLCCPWPAISRWIITEGILISVKNHIFVGERPLPIFTINLEKTGIIDGGKCMIGDPLIGPAFLSTNNWRSMPCWTAGWSSVCWTSEVSWLTIPRVFWPTLSLTCKTLPEGAMPVGESSWTVPSPLLSMFSGELAALTSEGTAIEAEIALSLLPTSWVCWLWLGED